MRHHWRPLVLVTLFAGHAFAESEPVEQVEVVSNGSPAALKSLSISLGELLARLNLGLHVNAVEGAPQLPAPKAGVMASATVDFADPADIVLQMADDRGSMRLTRRIAKSGSTAMQVEVVAHVLQSVAQELSEPAEVARRAVARQVVAPVVSQPPPPPPSVTEVTAAPPETPSLLPEHQHLALGAFGGARVFTATDVSANLGVGAWLHVPTGPVTTGALVTLGWNAPMQIPASIFTLSAQVVSIRALPTLGFGRIGRVSFEAALGPGLDLFVNSLRSSEVPANRLPPPHLDLTPVLTAGLFTRVRLTAGLEVFVGLTADADLLKRRFVAELPGAREVLFDPWGIRPQALAGLTFTPWEAR